MSRRRPGAVERWAIVSDLHFPEVDWPTWRCFRAWLADHPCHTLVFLGDLLDLESLSRFESGGDRDPAVLPQIRQFVAEANACSSHAQKTVIVEGNHEQRFFRKVADGIGRQVQGLVGLTLEEQCRFQGLIPSIDWLAEKPGWTGLRCGHLTIRHGHYDYPRGGPQHVAANLLVQRNRGRSAMIGHCHRQQLIVLGQPGERTEYALTNPTMQAQPVWDPRAGWSRGWTMLELDVAGGYAHPYPVLCERGRVAWGGRVYDGSAGLDAAGAAPAIGRSGRRRKPRPDWWPAGRMLQDVAREAGISASTLSTRIRAGASSLADATRPSDPRMSRMAAKSSRGYGPP